jgi:hypothetical protein
MRGMNLLKTLLVVFAIVLLSGVFCENMTAMPPETVYKVKLGREVSFFVRTVLFPCFRSKYASISLRSVQNGSEHSYSMFDAGDRPFMRLSKTSEKSLFTNPMDGQEVKFPQIAVVGLHALIGFLDNSKRKPGDEMFYKFDYPADGNGKTVHVGVLGRIVSVVLYVPDKAQENLLIKGTPSTKFEVKVLRSADKAISRQDFDADKSSFFCEGYVAKSGKFSGALLMLEIRKLPDHPEAYTARLVLMQTKAQ